jgi:hypothetical protein
MKLQDYIAQDTLNLALFAKTNPLAAGPSGIIPVLDAIDAHAGELMPDECSIGKKSVAYSRNAVLRLLSSQKRGHKTILSLSRRAEPEVDYTFNFVQPGWEVEFWLRVFIPLKYLSGKESALRSMTVIDLMRALAGACHTVYGYGHPRGDFSLGEDPHEDDVSVEKRVYEAYWLNIYGPEMVERIGRTQLLTTPATSVEELANRSVLWLTRPTPQDYASSEARIAQAKALAHLQNDISYDAALERLRERSTRLAAVQREWDPDIADLLELTLNNVSQGERQQEIGRLNFYRPPRVSEWRPIADLLASDVQDEQETIALYGNIYAERLAALLRKDAPR